ncbi:MAG TPA: flagellar basal-body MS-ring/collar protein FliF [Oscillatoriaceae cyanobacterium]
MNFFADLPAQAKALIGVLVLVAMVALGANFIPRGGNAANATPAGTPAGQIVIYSNQDPEAVGTAAGDLKDKGIPFQIVQDGTAISVPKNNADDARIQIALKDHLKDGTLGFPELFGDKPPGFISTDFDKKVAFNRALNGELSRLIRKIDGVEAASVLVNMPEDQLFSEDKKPTTAAVMVKCETGRSLSKDQVTGVQNLVASAVPGLKTSNVTVVSDTGTLLSDGLADNNGNVADREVARELQEQMDLTEERETAIENSVQSLLDKLFGPGKSVVRVNCDLDFSQRKTKTTLYAPPADAKGVSAPSNVMHSTQKSTNGSGGGVPGTVANVPGYPMDGGMTAANQSSTSSQDQEQYGAYSRNDSLTVNEIGSIKRMTVTALIQGLPAERVTAMTQIVAAAAGADVQGRGDMVVVQPVAFDTSQTDMLHQLIDQQKAPQTAAAADTKKKGGIPFTVIVGAGAAFIILALLIAIIRMANRKEDTTDVLVNTLGEPGMPADFDPNAFGGFTGEASGTVPQANMGPFGFLEQMDPQLVAELLSQQRPGAAAGVLGLLDPGYADMVLSVMPPDVQEDLINRLNTQPPMPDFQQRTLAQQLRRTLGVPA